MIRSDFDGKKNNPRSTSLDLDPAEVLSEVSIDEYLFKVTLHPLLEGRCVLWFCDTRTDAEFEALGHFTHFDKRNVLFFISRYATSTRLRGEIELRRFEKRISGMTPEFFKDIQRKSQRDKNGAFRCLFNLDDEIDSDALAQRRRMMAHKFHPDRGGDHQTMVLINEAYEHLCEELVKR